MATRTPTFTRIDDNTVKFSYAGMLNTDDGSPIPPSFGDYPDRSVQVIGALGAGGTVLVEGSNDGGTTYNTLNDAFGVALSITALSLKQLTEVAGHTRPRVSAGDGTTSLTIAILCRRARSAKAV